MKQLISQVFKTKVGLFILSTILCLTFGVLHNYYDWAFYPFIVFGIYPVCFMIVMIIFAWIINTIREYKSNKK